MRDIIGMQLLQQTVSKRGMDTIPPVATLTASSVHLTAVNALFHLVQHRMQQQIVIQFVQQEQYLMVLPLSLIR